MKLSTWAKLQGIHYKTAHKWFQTGKMPCKAVQLPTGTIIVYPEQQVNKQSIKNAVIYARVSSYDRKDCLNGQIQRCTDFANSNGYVITKVYKEIASGMNDKRPKLTEMLDSSPTYIITEHKDRLTRFGFNYIDLLLKKLNCTIIVLNHDKDDETDLMKDLISIITSFCCRLYGLRRGRNKATKLKNDIKQDFNNDIGQ